jgi:hypothetical protein
MNNDLFINSARVLVQNWELILAILACVSWGTLLTLTALKKITEAQFSDIELTTLALGGWPLPALVISVFFLASRFILSDNFISVITIIFLTASTGFAVRAMWKNISFGFIIPFIIFLFFVFIRLGFVNNATLPPYFDSAEHYRIIQSLIKMDNPLAGMPYYHLGYHIIVAAFTLLTHANPGQVMLLFGQVILAAIPLPIYFLIRRATNSNTAAAFGVALAAFGWFMPAHAINWGKYPALLSLLLIQFTLGAVSIKDRWLLAFSMMASVLIHTRAMILFAVFGLAWKLSAIPSNKRILIFVLTYLIMGMAAMLIKQNQTLGPVLEPYGIWVTLLVGLLVALVFQSFPRLTFSAMFSILMMLAGMFIPVTKTLTLLDRPLVEMSLFLPLTFLGGLGSTRLPKFIVPVLAIIIVIHAWTTYNFSPSTCCQLASRDDAVTLDWMRKNLPADARIAIASADLSLAPGSPMLGTGSDAGIWVAPLTGRTILALPYSSDFTIQSTHDRLCQEKVTHIYVGGLPRSFESGFINTKPEWYKMIFVLPNTHIIQILGCD